MHIPDLPNTQRYLHRRSARRWLRRQTADRAVCKMACNSATNLAGHRYRQRLKIGNVQPAGRTPHALDGVQQRQVQHVTLSMAAS